MKSVATDESSTLIELEKLIDRIVKSLFNIRLWDDATLNAFYEEILLALPRYLALYSPHYSYSTDIRFFLEQLYYLDTARKNISPDLPLTINDVAFLVDSLLLESERDWFRRRKYDRLYQRKKLHEDLCRYAALLHQKHSRLLVVRVDLYYSKDAQAKLGIDSVYQHLDQMIQQKYTNHPLFEHLAGYIWRVEQGETRGYHLHMVYYFLGSKHQNDWYMAKQIGDLWLTITNGLGTYHSCNTPEEKEKYAKLGLLGVGMIHRDKPEQVTNAINAVAYLARVSKDDQYLRMKPLNRREFGRGLLSA